MYIKLKKYKNTKHENPDDRLGEGQFGFVLDVRPRMEAVAEELGYSQIAQLPKQITTIFKYTFFRMTKKC